MSLRSRPLDDTPKRGRFTFAEAGSGAGSALIAWIARLRRRLSGDQGTSKAEQTRCHHRVLVPCWENPADLGIEARATDYRCDACGAIFNPVHAYLLRLETRHCLRNLGETRAPESASSRPEPAPYPSRPFARDRYDDRTFVRSLELAAIHLYGQRSRLINREGSTSCELYNRSARGKAGGGC
jgi:hypothetical protein